MEATSTTPLLPQDPKAAGPCFGKRHIFTLLGFAGLFMLYALRTDLSVAIVSMAKAIPDDGKNSTIISCVAKKNETKDNSTTAKTSGEEFNWNSNVQSLILSSFFWGYVVTQIPGGWMAEKFGSKQLLAISIGVSSLLTLLSPLAAGIGYEAFIVVRVLEGLCGGVAFPSMHVMIARWIPKTEVGFLSTLIYSGSQVGTVFAMGASGLLSDSGFLGGWPSIFYVFGFIGLVWVLFWVVSVYSFPEDHPSISPEELQYITAEKESTGAHKSTPWKAIVTSIPVWALVITHFGHNWGFYTILFQMPTYFKTILGFDVKQNGLLSAIPYILQASFGWLSSYIFDIIIRRKYLEVNTVRKLSNTIGFFGPAVCLIGVTYAECDPTWSVVLFSAAMAINGFYYCGFNCTHVDMAPEYAGTLMGLTNCVANFAGILAPNVTGLIIENESSVHTWANVFYLSALIYVVTAVIFVLFGSAHRQKWASGSSNT